MCLNRGRFAAVNHSRCRAVSVDHIQPRRAGGSDEHANLQSLCHACHSRKTLRQAWLDRSKTLVDRRFFIGEGHRPDRVRSLTHRRESFEVTAGKFPKRAWDGQTRSATRPWRAPTQAG